MILVSELDGRLVKSFASFDEGTYGYHHVFGFISEFAFTDRLKARKRKGLLPVDESWDCTFAVSRDANDAGWAFKALQGCSVEKQDKGTWRIATNFGNFKLLEAGNAEVSPFIADIGNEKDDDSFKPGVFAALLAFIIFMGLLFLTKQDKPVEQKVEEIVVILKEHKAVKVMETPKVVEQKIVPKKEVHRAVQQNLGFLGLVGQKNLSKAVGGAPTELKNASAGAGAGGDAGSGGELLVGLGKGVKRTTVGNTGVAGLGGIGTKGKGGGQGGYGDTLIASGEGKGLSTIGVSQDALLDGGLSKYVIQATINRYLNQVRACYEAELKGNPALTGIITMDFEVGATGMLNFAKVQKSSLGNKSVEDCVATKMLGWQFPKPRGGVKVPASYPFQLRPSGV